MNIINDIKSIKAKVTSLLIEFHELRDCDSKLIAMIWQHEIGFDSRLTAQGLLTLLAQCKLTNPESIRRCRQTLQAKNESLQGEKYKARQKMGVEVIKVIKDV